MSKHSKQDQAIFQKPLSFLRFWCFVSSEVGNHRLSINASASDLKTIFNCNAIHADHIKSVVIDSYLPHKDQLQQPIDLNHLLDCLGEVAYKLKQQNADDLMDIELLEEIAWIISTYFLHLIPTRVDPGESKSTEEHSSVISIRQFKSRNQLKN